MAAGAVVPVVLAHPAAAAMAAAVKAPAATLRRSMFTPLTGATFTMTDSRRSSSVVLSEITDLQPSATPGDDRRFSLLFRATVQSKLPQGTYRLVNAKLGPVTLFVVPVDRAMKAQSYQAIISGR